MTRLVDRCAAVTYNSTLERLWAGFASHLSHGTIRICPYCGRAFIPEPSNMKYCKLDPVKECKVRKDEDDKNRKRKLALWWLRRLRPTATLAISFGRAI